MSIFLEKGSTGGDVRKWQSWLQLEADGDFGTKTEQATMAFQRAQGLTIDGKVGPKTLSKAVAMGLAGFDLKAPLIVKKPVVTPTDSHIAIFKGTENEKINLAMMSRLAPKMQQKLLVFLEAAAADGVELRIVQALRTWAEQDALFAQGRTKPGDIVTNARGGQSFHNFGVAADLAPVIDGTVDKVKSWKEKLFVPYKEWATKAGLEWGGNWKHIDLPHVQLPRLGNKPSKAMLNAYRSGGLNAVWVLVEDI
jgi:peptidoglycan L-alanyl-D-glutamate endopeptidase CwlK